MDFGDAHFGGVALVVVEDIALTPIDIRLFGARGVVFDAKDVTVSVEKFFILWSRHSQGGCIFLRGR